jgi:hypothetical protein
MCAPGAGEAAMTPSSTAQGIKRQRAGAAVSEKEVGIWAWGLEDQALAIIAQREIAEQLPVAVSSSVLDGEREPEPRRSGGAEQLFAAEVPSLISALNDKSEPGPRQLLYWGSVEFAVKCSPRICPVKPPTAKVSSPNTVSESKREAWPRYKSAQ